jgi:hypothetical protein
MEQIFEEGVERQSVEDWMRELFGASEQETAQTAEQQHGSSEKEEEKANLEEEVRALQAQLAMMQLNAIVERVKAEFYAEKPHLRDFADILEKLASARIQEIVASGKQLDSWDKVPAFIKGVLNEVGKSLEERLGLAKKTSASELVGIPPAGVSPAGAGAEDEGEYSKYPGVEFPLGKNMTVRVVSDEDLWRWRRDTARKYVEERMKELKKRQQGWVEGYRR